MSKYSDFVNSIKPYPFEDYARVSSREKLMAYTVSFLESNDIPTSFIYLCVASFKLFPDKFYFSEEFKEYPHIEMLNRTILHLRPKENNYATGSVSTEYRLTPLGEEISKQVAVDLATENDSEQPIQVRTMDKKKKAIYNDLQRVLDSREYGAFEKTGVLNESAVWSFFGITPYTQAEYTKKFAKDVKAYAEEKGEKTAVHFLDEVMKVIS